MSLELVIGAGIVGFLVLTMMNSLDEKHWVMKLVMLVFVASLLLLFPKIAIDSLTVCSPVVDTIDTVGAIQTYNYTSYCYTSTVTTGLSFLKTTQLLYYLLLGYAIVSIALWSMYKLVETVKKRGNR